MGYHSNLMIEQQEQKYNEHKEKWIQEQLGDSGANEDYPAWDELSEAFDELYGQDFWDFEEREEPAQTKYAIFLDAVEVANKLLTFQLTLGTKENVMIMLHGHIISALEGYLSSTFISLTLNSNKYIKKLVESDPEFAKRTFTVKEIFSTHESLNGDIAKYLQNIIFHKIDKVSLMYRSVLGINFGDVAWLFKAVALRHHCVHRAGYDKEGNKVLLEPSEILTLTKKCTVLVKKIELEVNKL